MSEDNEFFQNSKEEDIREIMRDALIFGLNERKKRVKQDRLNSALTGTLNEFLNSFILLGFNLDGNAVVLTSKISDIQKKALKSLLIEYITYNFGEYEDI